MLAVEVTKFTEHLDAMFDALSARKLTPTAAGTWFKHLQNFPSGEVFAEIDDCVRTRSKPPVCADLWKTLTEKRSTSIEQASESYKAAEKRDAENLFAGRTPIGDAAVAELRKLLRPNEDRDPKAWAKKLLDRISAGDVTVNPTMMEMCRRALGISTDEFAHVTRFGRTQR